jgi:DNA-binding NarL/FixJ family response regulator
VLPEFCTPHTLLRREVVGEADNGEEAARLAVSGEADIALLDIEMHERRTVRTPTSRSCKGGSTS